MLEHRASFLTHRYSPTQGQGKSAIKDRTVLSAIFLGFHVTSDPRVVLT